MGCRVLGDIDSPVIPIMLYHPEKIYKFSHACLRRGLATVVVGFPATPLLLSRARFCIAASHTPEELERALQLIEEAAYEVRRWLANGPTGKRGLPVKIVEAALRLFETSCRLGCCSAV